MKNTNNASDATGLTNDAKIPPKTLLTTQNSKQSYGQSYISYKVIY